MKSGFSLSGAARDIGISERTLARRMRVAMGKSPLSYFQDLRIGRGVRELRAS